MGTNEISNWVRERVQLTFMYSTVQTHFLQKSCFESPTLKICTYLNIDPKITKLMTGIELSNYSKKNSSNPSYRNWVFTILLRVFPNIGFYINFSKIDILISKLQKLTIPKTHCSYSTVTTLRTPKLTHATPISNFWQRLKLLNGEADKESTRERVGD
jgi:hypothetical protein